MHFDLIFLIFLEKDSRQFIFAQLPHHERRTQSSTSIGRKIVRDDEKNGMNYSVSKFKYSIKKTI